jgi:GT2 family glycosyltransferase
LKPIFNDRNYGFAAANNIGLKHATGDVLILLNNDTLVTPGWIRGLARWLRDPSIGLVGSVTNSIGNEARIPVDYTNRAELLRFAAQRSQTHRGKNFNIPMLAMYCVAMRRDVYEQAGPIDEQYEVGMFEDDDYARRVRKLGKRIVCAEDVFIHHFGSASFGKLGDACYQEIFSRNRARFEKKWSEAWTPPQLRK